MLKRNGIDNLQKQIKQLDSALRTSFANLKRDFLGQGKTIEKLKAKITKQERALEQLNIKSAEQEKYNDYLAAELAKLKRNQTSRNTKPSKSSVTQKATSTQPKSQPGLTPLHLQLLKHLMILQLESGRRSVSMRELASELYPDKAYSSIKTTLSKYIKELDREGFIEKINTGRLFVSYTEKALQYADDARLNRMKDLISKPMDR